MQVYKQIIKSTGKDFFTFYATTGAEKCNHQLVVATTGAFTLTSVHYDETEKMAHDSQIARAKENLKLSHGEPSYSQASGTNPNHISGL